MSWLGPLIGAAGALGSAWLGSESAEDQMNAQQEFAKHGVQWRVEDAQRAGVHPLFALGGSTQGYTPSPVSYEGVARAGEIVGNAVSASADVEQRALMKAQIQALKMAALKDFSESSYWDSQAALARQKFGQSSPFPELATDQETYASFGDKTQVYNPYSDAIVRRLNPEIHDLGFEPFAEALEPRGGLSSGTREGWTRWDFGDGPIVGPYVAEGQSFAESIEGLDAVMKVALIAENRRRYGDAGVRRIMKLLDPRTGGPSKPSYGSQRGKHPADAFSEMPPW